MACYAPLFVNVDDRRWNPNAIVFNSSHLYGTPSYWMQLFFVESNGATLLNLTLNSPTSLMGSAITWVNLEDNKNYLRVKLSLHTTPPSILPQILDLLLRFFKPSILKAMEARQKASDEAMEARIRDLVSSMMANLPTGDGRPREASLQHIQSLKKLCE
ncbi:hypothetical protein LguiA_026639 [Lonicera macranthoides]